MFRSIALLASLAFLGCASPTESADCRGSFRLGSMTEWEAARVHSAEQRFNAFVGREVVKVDSGACIIEETSAPASVLAVEPDTVAWYDPETGSIGFERSRIDCGEDAACFETKIIHEIAHSFGMMHLPEGEEGIMASAAGTEFTTADRRECERVRLCR